MERFSRKPGTEAPGRRSVTPVACGFRTEYFQQIYCSLTKMRGMLQRQARNLGSSKDPLFHISLYLNHLAPSNGTKGAITLASYGIRWVHTVAGLPSPTVHQFAQTTSEGAQRLLSTAVNEKEPITSELFSQLTKKKQWPHNRSKRFAFPFHLFSQVHRVYVHRLAHALTQTVRDHF